MYTWSWIKNPAEYPGGRFVTLLISVMYDGCIIFKSELMLAGSEYPKGPYIGLPSYAHPTPIVTGKH